MSQPPKNRPPVRRVNPGEPAGPPQGGQRVRQPQQNPRQTNVNVQRKSDPFPIVIGGIFLLLVVGLLAIVFLISMNNNKAAAPVSGSAPAPATAVGVSDANTAAPGVAATVASGPTEEPAVRIPLAEFKTLYDDPAKRPLIIDVRGKEQYDQGHIAGAISFPEADVDTRYKEIPKDKLVVAYCQ